MNPVIFTLQNVDKIYFSPYLLSYVDPVSEKIILAQEVFGTAVESPFERSTLDMLATILDDGCTYDKLVEFFQNNASMNALNAGLCVREWLAKGILE